jgi:hypothetical protein
MKQIKFSVLLLLISSIAGAQTFIGLSAGSNGAGVSVGYLSAPGIEVSAGYSMPLISAEKPHVFYAAIGKQLLLTQNEEDNFSITPSVGIAHSSRKDFTEYDKGGPILTIENTKPLYSIEIGKDWYHGRLFVSGSYCGVFSVSVGMRAFIK